MANKTTNMAYNVATAGTIPLYTTSAIGASLAGNYTQNLFKNTVIDEQGNAIYEIKDLDGKIIQKAIEESTGNYLITHYVYDDLDRLAYIIQPEGYASLQSFTETDVFFTNYVFAYHYDSRGRISDKHVPAGGWTRFVYDKKDRKVLEQNAHQATLNRWNFIKYDVHNREVFKGETENTNAITTLQTAFDTHITPDEVWSSTGGYSGTSFPTLSNPTGLEVQYYTFYDQYDFRDALAPSFTFNSSQAFYTQYTNTKGLKTGYVSYHSDNHNRYNLGVQFFDSKNRLIQTYDTHIKSSNNTGEPILKNWEYNYIGEEIREKTFAPFLSDTITILENTTKDHVGRTTNLFQSINNSPLEEIIRLNYDVVGRPTVKKFMPNGTYTAGGTLEYITRPPSPSNGTIDIAKKAITLNPGTEINPNYLGYIDPNATGGTSISGLQTIDYKHHIRGLVSGINLDVNGLPNANTSEGDLFASKLEFETQNQYSGNIGKNTWQIAGQNRNFAYNYDHSDRLKSSIFTGLGSENYGLTDINYDRNGNILTATRKGKNGTNFGDIDKLSYFYTGNKLNGVTDAVSGNVNTGDFRDNGSGSDYTYNPDGSLTSDLNRGISGIEYNTYLSKISRVNYTDGRFIDLIYDGDGNLLRTQNSLKESKEFALDFLFKNNVLYQKTMPEGRIVFENGGWNREFEYRDIWNNLRLSFAAENGNLVTKQTSDFDAWGYAFNETVTAKSSDYKYQNQLRLTDFDIGLDLFKFRASDPQIGKLLAVDPLSEKYAYNSVYALQENKFGKGVELEGAELNEFVKWADKKIDQVLSYTDFDDAAVLVTQFSRNGKAIHIDGQPASIPDKVFAAIGAVIPVASGAAVKKVIDAVGDVFKNRVKLQKATKEVVLDASRKTKDGKFIDPNTQKPIEKGQEVFGHKRGQEWSKYKKDPANKTKTRKEVIKDQNDPNKYQIEDKKSNASHRFEEK